MSASRLKLIKLVLFLYISLKTIWFVSNVFDVSI